MFPARSGDFRPVTLPGEFTTRQQQQGVDLSSGFARFPIAHILFFLSPCDQCHDDAVATNFLSGDVSAMLQAPGDEMPAH